MASVKNDYISILHEHFLERRRSFSDYSLYFFARDLGMTPSHLSDVLAGRRGLSEKNARKIAECLELPTSEAERFVTMVNSRHARGAKVRELARQKLTTLQQTELAGRGVHVFDHWSYPAILLLLQRNGGRADTPTFAAALGVPESRVAIGLEGLQALGLLEKRGDVFHSNEGYYMASSPTPQKTIRGFHEQVLRVAASRLEAIPPLKRKNVATIFSFDRSRISEAREFIEKMHTEFLTRFQTDERAHGIYALSFNLFDLEKESAE